MDTTIRNLDASLYRRIRARAAMENTTVGTVVNAALRQYLSHPRAGARRPSPFDVPKDNWGEENVSEHIDDILYGEHA